MSKEKQLTNAPIDSSGDHNGGTGGARGNIIPSVKKRDYTTVIAVVAFVVVIVVAILIIF
jgi:hypothetical protein